MVLSSTGLLTSSSIKTWDREVTAEGKWSVLLNQTSSWRDTKGSAAMMNVLTVGTLVYSTALRAPALLTQAVDL